jgi:hypothetical protein
MISAAQPAGLRKTAMIKKIRAPFLHSICTGATLNNTVGLVRL